MTTLLPIEARGLIRRASAFINASPDDLLGPCRSDRLARARFAIMAELRALGWSYARIAKALGRKDHTTIIHGVKMARLLMGHSDHCDPNFIELVGALRQPTSTVLPFEHKATRTFIPGVTDEGPARAAPAIWPYEGHGTLEDQRLAQEASQAKKRLTWRERYNRDRKSTRRSVLRRKAG